MLLNKSKPKQLNRTNRSSIKIKTTQEKYKCRKENFSFSLSPSFRTIKVNNPKKRNTKKSIIKKVNNSNSTSNLNNNKKKISKSKDKAEKNKK